MTEIETITKLAAIYARVSTGRQEKEETIIAQLSALRESANKKGYKIIKEYIDDGWSGDLIARPALDQLRGDAKKKIWEEVLVYDPDRIARTHWLQGLVMSELEEFDLDISFLTIATPKTDEDKVLFSMRGVMAQYEKMRITERFRLGKLRKVKEGHVLTSRAPFGYNYIPRKDKQHGYYEINKQEAEIVKMMFKWVAEDGMTIRGVIKKLKSLDIKPRESKRGVWSTSTLSTIFRNRTYIGEAHYGRSYAVVPENPIKKEVYKKIKKTSRKLRPEEEWIIIPVLALIDRKLFEKVGRQLKTNFALCRRNKKNEYLLAGKIFCTCGRRRAGEGPMHGKHLYYRCADRVYSFPLPPKCKEKGLNARIVDVLVWNKISELMTSPELIKNQSEKWSKKEKESPRDFQINVAEFKKEIEKLKKEDDRYVKAYGAEVIDINELRNRKNDLKDKISTLEAQILNFEQQTRDIRIKALNLPTREELASFCQKANEVLKYLNFEAKQKIVREVIEKIIGNQRELLVEGYLPVGTNNNYAFSSIHRNSRVAQCWQINLV
jgi:site-specific DNA recombinase